APGPFRSPVALGTVTAIGAIRATVPIGAILVRAIVLGTRLAMPARPAVLPLGRPIHGSLDRSCDRRVSGRRDAGLVQGLGPRMRFRACARRPPGAAGS